MARHWASIPPEEAVALVLPHVDVVGPLNEEGRPCPWPWGPQQKVGVPMGQYRCPYCWAMCVAGIPHLDYREDPLSAIGDAVDDRSARTAHPDDQYHGFAGFGWD